MRKSPWTTPKPADDPEEHTSTGDSLDETLRRLGEDFLEDEVPAEMIEAIRGGMELGSDEFDSTDIDDH